MLQKMSITVKGKSRTWCFEFIGDEQYLKEWRDDGLDISRTMNEVPVWVVDMGLTRVWCFVQDVWNFRNPFK